MRFLVNLFRSLNSTLRAWIVKDFAPHLTATLFLMLLGAVGSRALQTDVSKLALLAIAMAMIVLVWAVYSLTRRAHADHRDRLQRTRAFHQFVHRARDLLVQLLDEHRRTSQSLKGPRAKGVRLQSNHLAEVALSTMLGSLVDLFSTFTKGRVWVCLRELRADGTYHTIARAGSFSADRAASSRALHKSQDASVCRLRENYQSGSCVYLTGSDKGPDCWTPQPNDVFGEDKCVLMGAVLVKSWDGEQIKPLTMTWIVSVCADRTDAFNDAHLALMQGCVDVLSIVVNVLARTASGGAVHPAELSSLQRIDVERHEA